MPYTYPYPRPSVTVDCVIFGKDESNEWRVLLIERAHPPFEGKWALPGGFIDENESADDAANRELWEETGVQHIQMTQFYTFSTPGRDPRGWTISIAYWAEVELNACKVEAGSDARKAEWIKVNDIQEMAFDHQAILQKALQVLEQ